MLENKFNTKLYQTGIRRRSIVFFAACLGIANGVFAAGKKSMVGTARFVFPKLKWSPGHLHDFLRSLPEDARLTLKKSLDLLKADASVHDLKHAAVDADDIQKQVFKLSSNILIRPFKDSSKLDYHELVTWVSKEAGVNKSVINSASTFTLERELFKMLFAKLWDKMTIEQRQELLAKIDSTGQIKDKAALVGLGGASALAALSTTVAFSGFAFYTTMSVAIASVASALGIVLPMAVYTSAASIVGILAGPIGWAIMGLTALGSFALLGRADLQKTTAFITQIHALKVEALAAAGVPEKSIF